MRHIQKGGPEPTSEPLCHFLLKQGENERVLFVEVSSSYGNCLQKWNQPYTCSLYDSSSQESTRDLDDQRPKWLQIIFLILEHWLILYHQAMVKGHTLGFSITSAPQSQSNEVQIFDNYMTSLTITHKCKGVAAVHSARVVQKTIHPLQKEKR